MMNKLVGRAFELGVVKFVCAFSLISVFSGSALASDNTGYGEIVEIKVWPNYIDIYSEHESICTKGGHEERYILDKSRNQTYSILVAAMSSGMTVNINYSCGSSGVAEIYGVRVKGP